MLFDLGPEELVQAYISRGFSWVGITEHMPPTKDRFRYPDEVDAGLDAAALYRRLLSEDPSDTVARNNLANIEFAGGDYDAARVRFRQGAEVGGSAEVAATSFYNLSLAHLEKFEYQAYNEADPYHSLYHTFWEVGRRVSAERRRYGPPWAELLFTANPRLILEGEPISPADHPAPPRPHKWYRFW